MANQNNKLPRLIRFSLPATQLGGIQRRAGGVRLPRLIISPKLAPEEPKKLRRK